MRVNGNCTIFEILDIKPRRKILWRSICLFENSASSTNHETDNERFVLKTNISRIGNSSQLYTDSYHLFQKRPNPFMFRWKANLALFLLLMELKEVIRIEWK